MNTPLRAKVAARILASEPARFDAMVRRGCILLRHEHNPDIPCNRAGKCTGQAGGDFEWGDVFATLDNWTIGSPVFDELPVNVRRKKSQ